jgi:lipopolysaccharide/colanic/teichoic acid biosynthesis glycosyltransferase
VTASLAAKRALDLAVAVPLLLLTLPVQAVVASAVAADLGRPVLFAQARPGRDGIPFTMRKFRSMRDVDPSRGLVDDASRLTPFGRWLRASSLDELPTLWNVVRGEMSLVGPRPLLVQYLPLYSPAEARRHEVAPGLTGLAQVSGRNALSWQEKFALDVEYVDRRSLLLDLRILVATARAVLLRKGISADGEATMPVFAGTTAREP